MQNSLLQSDRIPPGYEWLKEVFTDEEINSLCAFYNDDDGTFSCIGFKGSNGKVMQFAEPIKARAIELLERDFRRELALLIF
jgi:hypothetical protein